jgi:hypothetical protein
MRQMIYSMRFTGQVAPIGTSPTVMKAKTSAESCTLTTVVGPEGLHSALEQVSGGRATFESDVTFIGGFESSEVTSAGEGGFRETGTITFGEGGHRLHFSTIGQGYIGPSAELNLRQGTVMWQIDAGEGQFKGARGLITSNFTVSEAGEVTDYHFGVIFLA